MTKTERRSLLRFGRRSGTAELEPRRCSLDIRNLVYSDDGAPLLSGAFLSVRPDMTTCVVGTSGKDQSTFLSLIMGLEEPEGGVVTLNGVDVRSLPLEELRSEIAIVLQEPWIVNASILDNIAFDTTGISNSQVRRAARLAGVDHIVQGLPFGLHTNVSDGISTGVDLTLGQRRHIALARALVRNPGVLLFEEPTTDILPDEERRMVEAIDRAAVGRATIIASHRLSLARRADSVYVLENGRLVPYRGAGKAPTGDLDHSTLWDLRVPPVVEPEAPRRHLRLVRSNDRPVPEPALSSWGVRIGSEIAPGYLASGLLSRNELTETWVGWSSQREEPVRIKIPRTEPVVYPAYEQLFREYKTLQGLHHPALARAYAADLEADMPYVVFEYLDSSSLAQVAQRRGIGLDPLDVLYTGFELAGALNYLHQRGFVHLNLRARHVRTRQDTIVLTDFTHTRQIGAPLPEPTTPVRARRLEHRYFAPEFLPGRAADPKMDVYSLGALMHRATAGSVVTKVTSAGVGLAPYASVTTEAPEPMAIIVDQMLARHPGDRPTAEEVLSEFRKIMPRSLVRPRVSSVAARYPMLRLITNN